MTRAANWPISTRHLSLYPTLAGKSSMSQLRQLTHLSSAKLRRHARKVTLRSIQLLKAGFGWEPKTLQNGLVDQLGGLNRAIAMVRQRAHLSATGETNLVIYPPRRTLFEVLTSSSTDAFAEAMAERKIRRALPGLPSRALLEGGIMHILPYQFRIQ